MTPRDAFLAAFSLHPAGVAVITARRDDGTPVGFTATSLASYSAEPPRATVNIAQHASSYSAVSVGAPVALHFLDESQVGVAQTMAGDHDRRFVGDHWRPDERGVPRIDGARAILDGHVVAVTEFGDNATVIIEIDGGNTRPDAQSLVYVERRYHSIGPVVEN